MQFKICEMCKIEERKRNGILRSNYKQTTIKQEKNGYKEKKQPQMARNLSILKSIFRTFSVCLAFFMMF